MRKKNDNRVRVIRDVSDGRRDYWMDTAEAERLYAEGKLDRATGIYGSGERCYIEKERK